jgi:EF-hand domain pair
MSVAMVSSSSSAYAYLQSLLPPQSADGSQSTTAPDPVSQLLDAFYPNGASSPSGTPAANATAAATPASTIAGPPFDPDTMSALMSVQEQQQQQGNPFVTAQAQDLFSQFDANGDGQISQTEFEGAFGPGADQSKVDGLFNALDTNGDGSVSFDELNSAAQSSHAQHGGGHHHHHHSVDSGQGGGGDMWQSLLSSGTQGASAATTANSDGSSTTTISYADGSKVALTTPPGASGSGTSDSNASGNGSGGANDLNYLEQLIQLQAQSLTLASSQTLASV